MARTIPDRQTPLVALIALTPADIAGGGVKVKIPRGTLLTSLTGWKQTAFNTGGTTPAITVKAADSAATLISDEVLTGTGAITVDTATKYYPTGDVITVTIAESAASDLVPASAGLALLKFEYVSLGRGGDIQD